MLSVEPTNNQSFKSITTLRVSQKAFTNPKNVNACVREVDKVFTGTSRLQSFFDAIKAVCFGIKPKNSIVVCPNDGKLANIENKEGVETFLVLTGREANEFFETISLKNAFKSMVSQAREAARIEAEEAASAGRKPKVVRSDSKQFIADRFRKLKWNFETRPVKEQEINVESLEDLVKRKESIINF